jgi:ADP-ribosylglycohydrolase
MRVAPIGLMFNPQKGYSIEQIDKFGADAAALTHGHPLGYIPAAALVHIVNRLTYTNMTPKEAVIDAINTLPKIFDNSNSLSELIALMRKALSLATSTFSDISCIHLLGQGWTGHEALVIAIFCAVRYSNDFEKAIIAAVNHRGDSDSTGAITGNILGAYLGIKGIPKKFINNLELKDLIIEIASDLYACQNITTFDENWKLKYMAK